MIYHPGDYVWGEKYALHRVVEVVDDLVVLDSGRSVYPRQIRGVVRPGDEVRYHGLSGNWKPGIFQVDPIRVEFPNGCSVPLHSARYLRVDR